MRALRLTAVAALLAAVLAYAAFRSHPLVADRPPGRIETAIARRLVVLSIPASVRDQRNPNPAGGDAWREGADHFQDHCAVCHGSDGRGRSRLGGKMYPPVPDLAAPDVQEMSDGALFAVIQNGVRWTGMPAFRSEHSPEQTWELVSYIRRIPRLGANGRDAGGHAGAASLVAHDHGTVTMDGTAFVPSEITVRVGETVTWINQDPFPHTVSSGGGRFRSDELAPGQRWQFTPAVEGRFAYVCTLHPGMNGTLVVEGGK